MKKRLHIAAVALAVIIVFAAVISSRSYSTGPGNKQKIDKWVEVLQPSVLDREERMAELLWFAEASKNLRGITITSVAENIETHYWESRVLARAFKDITGINVVHKIIPEGKLVPLLVGQIEQGKHNFDIYVNDADLIGYHLRTKKVVNITEYIINEGKEYTNPRLDIADFLNPEQGQDYDGNQLQLPDQQFANLYWFRYDWFTRNDIKTKFLEKYGYELGVPVNWSAYEDIAEFFTTTPIDGRRVYGHFDYGKPSPSLGWRFTDAWLALAGVGDKGLPNGYPVDEWGIRVENRIPAGSSVSRGGAINGPAAVYALEKYITWMRRYAPAESLTLEWHDAGPLCSRGDIAQNIFQYITWLSDPRFHTPGSPVCDKNGRPLWRVAPTPHGRYWDKGMKLGYQDAGCWTIPSDTRGKKLAASWLWAQFCVSKTVSLKKFIIGGTPVRKSTVFSDYLTEHMDEYGGIIEFYRSSDVKRFTGSGRNVPHYPSMSKVWWTNIADAIKEKTTPQQAMNNIAIEQDRIMSKLKMKACSPVLNRKKPQSEWLDKHPGDVSPKRPRHREKPLTVPYEVILENWKEKR
ncbi:MAG TPA: carbohydrate ABC transporter substrate-binding protein [Spirochaetota bacterium]|nr:carbohydrate ABC transporter substrate-binding protein [Spirochaetota bacterium]